MRRDEDEYFMTEEQRIQREIELEQKKKNGRKWAKIELIIIFSLGVLILVFKWLCELFPAKVQKPVVYLYPETTTEVAVQLDVKGSLTVTYPKYQNGWKVTAEPDGTLKDADGKEYNYLYWEAETNTRFDMSEGFCVKGSETAEFLEKALAELGLTRREANEFIVYWLPLMEKNAYNVISFQGKAYTDSAVLTVEPKPDTVIRVFMTWYGSKKPVSLKPQILTAPERKGFTVVEWGGSELSHKRNIIHK